MWNHKLLYLYFLEKEKNEKKYIFLNFIDIFFFLFTVYFIKRININKVAKFEKNSNIYSLMSLEKISMQVKILKNIHNWAYKIYWIEFYYSWVILVAEVKGSYENNFILPNLFYPIWPEFLLYFSSQWLVSIGLRKNVLHNFLTHNRVLILTICVLK